MVDGAIVDLTMRITDGRRAEDAEVLHRLYARKCALLNLIAQRSQNAS
jgi:hypothetical protein